MYSTGHLVAKISGIGTASAISAAHSTPNER